MGDVGDMLGDVEDIPYDVGDMLGDVGMPYDVGIYLMMWGCLTGRRPSDVFLLFKLSIFDSLP